MKHDRLPREEWLERRHEFCMRTARFELLRVSCEIAPCDFQKKEVCVIHGGDEPMRDIAVSSNEKRHNTRECRFEESICVTPYA